MTDSTAPIFGLRNLPEVVKGALFARYSRSPKGLREILLTEFLSDQAGSVLPDTTATAADQARANAFYDRVLLGYGDESVAELGGAHIACEGISNIAAKAIEDSRIGISPLEQSTRYLPFGEKENGHYRYVRETAIMQSAWSDEYERVANLLFATYQALLPPTLTAIQMETPRQPETSERAYANATRAKAYDLLRGLLPMATKTNVGLYGNGRAFELLINKLQASRLQELNQVANGIQAALNECIPAFVKRPQGPHGKTLQAYLKNTADQTHTHVFGLQKEHPAELRGQPHDQTTHDNPTVTLIDYDTYATTNVVADIIYHELDISLEDARRFAHTMSLEQQAQLIRIYAGERESRFHKPGRAFERPVYTFDILADLGAYRDLQRHRILTQERQAFTTIHGYVIPDPIRRYLLAEPYATAIEAAAEIYPAIAAELPAQAQYIVPLACRTRWRITINLRAAYHLIELRSGRQGHPSYRKVAIAMYQAIREVHPILAEAMHFVDTKTYDLERLAAEERNELKHAARQE